MLIIKATFETSHDQWITEVADQSNSTAPHCTSKGNNKASCQKQSMFSEGTRKTNIDSEELDEQ